MNLKFQVADVKKPLISVKRILEQGNHVGFGPTRDDNFILNKSTGDRMLLDPKGQGSFVMKVAFEDGTSTEITVDSGAEENVCPYWWGQQYGIKPASKWLNLVNASGGKIYHYGTRMVKVVSPF